MSCKRISYLGFIAVVAAVAPAGATTFQFGWLENGSNINLGTQKTFTENGMSVTAYAFYMNGTQNGATNALYAKNGGSHEIGLGTTADPNSGQNEIVYSDYVLLDFSDVMSRYNVTSASLQMQSVTAGEGWEWFAAAAMPGANLGTHFKAGSDEGSHDILSQLGQGKVYLSIHETVNTSRANVLLGQLTINATARTPEPATAWLVIGSVAVLCVLRRRAAKKRSM